MKKVKKIGLVIFGTTIACAGLIALSFAEICHVLGFPGVYDVIEPLAVKVDNSCMYIEEKYTELGGAGQK